MKAVMYIRVSTIDQDYDRQFKELNELAQTDNFEIVKKFEDKISGTIRAATRTGFNEMIKFLEEGDIKQVYVWEISRIGRSLRDTVNIIYDFDEKGINIRTKKENLNTISKDPTQILLRNNLISLAEYELATIKERTISGTYNSIRNGGTGGGIIPQYGYKRVNNKLVIDQNEATVILDVCDKYLNKDWSVKQIADFLNETGVETRYRKLIKAGKIKTKRPSDLLWTDGSVARLLHKKLLTGFRKYGKVEQQMESLRIVDDKTFKAIQVKMEKKRKSKANSQKYEHILRGTLVCGNCGSSLVMQKSRTGFQNHYQCYKRFTKKDKSCKAAMINIDLLNNLVYQKAKDFKVASKDVEKRINELESLIERNNSAVNQQENELKSIAKEEEKLVELFIKDLIKLTLYQEKLKELRNREETIKAKQKEFELSNTSLKQEIKELKSKQIVDLSNPKIFKANARELIEKVVVKNLSDEDLVQLNDEISQMKDKLDDYVIRHKVREKIYSVEITMFDHNTKYRVIAKSTEDYGDIIKVEEINPQDKNKDLFRTKQSKPKDLSFRL